MSDYDHNARSEAEERIKRESQDLRLFPAATTRREMMAWALGAWAELKDGRTPYDMKQGMREVREELGLADPAGLVALAIEEMGPALAENCDKSDLRDVAWRLSWRHH
jgi:hypothetical protein